MYAIEVGTSKNGCKVYASIINSAAARYISRQPHIVRLVKDVIEPLDLKGPNIDISQDMGRIIGNTNIVATTQTDTTFYARPPKQTATMRFVKNRSMEPSNEISLALKQDGDGNYELTDVWIGSMHPPFPDQAEFTADSKEYWETHALTAGSEVVDLQSVTAECPY